jgi:hypothetical protein
VKDAYQNTIVENKTKVVKGTIKPNG